MSYSSSPRSNVGPISPAKSLSESESNPGHSGTKTVPLESIPGPPDGGWGWVVCFASFLCNVILDGIAYSFGILLGPLVIHFNSNRSSISWVGSLFCGVYMASGPIVGGLVIFSNGLI